MSARYSLLLFCFFCVLFIPLSVHSSESAGTPKLIRVLIIPDNAVPPDKDAPLSLLGKMNGDLLVNGVRYSGHIEVWKGPKGLYVINELPLEDYVESVVASEIGPNWDAEAVKAQAVISRTYAVFRKDSNRGLKFDLTSSVLSQVYNGDNQRADVRDAVRDTAGEILTYNGKPIEAFYHSTCGGKTEDPKEVFGKSYPYLKSVKCDDELSPYWEWERKITLGDIEKALGLKAIKDISISSRTSTGRAKELAVKSECGRTFVRATDLRKLLGWSVLPSTNFTVRINGGFATFDGKGYGHGVGLCQWGALQMAREGKTYGKILLFFYPGTRISHYGSR